MSNFVIGTCEDFCPQQEAKLRIRERLLHFYELHNIKKNFPGIIVKSFSRSAAGVKSPRPKDLRTVRCLQRTVEYLLKEVMLDERKPYYYLYQFIFDRMRAVRQEVIVQNFNAQQIVKLLGPIIMFLSYSRYRLCEDAIDNFDPKICYQHLQESLKRVLCCYDELELYSNYDTCTINDVKNRIFIEALYQIFNLGSIEARRRCIQLPKDIRTNSVFKEVSHIAMSYYQGNLFRVLNGIKKCAIASLKLQIIRRYVKRFSEVCSTIPLFLSPPITCCIES